LNRVLLSSINDSSLYCLNKYYNQIMTSPFFLTRQTANLMEDFTRELKAGAPLFLLYGESGVGKTRLLQELGQSRLADRRIHWLDLSEGSGSEDTLQDNSRGVEAIFTNAQQGDIIITDHFEMALQKTRHQLFLSWSTDGIDKQLNLIIASNIEGFNELRQLSQQYQVRVQSFQQMPFSADEVDAFVGFYLFPENPIGKLSIPPILRRQLAATRGAVGKIIEIIERDGAQIGSSTTTDSASIHQGGRIITAVLILFLLAVGVGWYYLGNQSALVELVRGFTSTETESMTIVEPVVETEVEPEIEVAAKPGDEAETVAVAVIELETSEEQVTELEPEAEPEPGAELESEPGAELEAATESVPETDSATESATQDAATVEPGTVSDTEAVIVEEEDSAQQETTLSSETTISSDPAQIQPSSATRFQRELERSYDWLTSKAASVGTMQILSLSFKTFDAANFYEYVESLASKQVDTTQLKVFKTYTGGTEVYSVFYGEYASRQAAKKAKSSLPEVLRKISPIARSVGGILQEIRRLEAES
jgi:septal ring-binding cell division protein DamX